MAEASLSVSVPAWRLRTDAEIGGGIAKLKGANLKNGNINGRAADCTLTGAAATACGDLYLRLRFSEDVGRALRMRNLLSRTFNLK